VQLGDDGHERGREHHGDVLVRAHLDQALQVRNCSASGRAIMIPEAAPSAAAAIDPPSASACRAIARFMLSGSWMCFSLIAAMADSAFLRRRPTVEHDC
jgi:hypothetical protein